jgi:hypothetical protein
MSLVPVYSDHIISHQVFPFYKGKPFQIHPDEITEVFKDIPDIIDNAGFQ